MTYQIKTFAVALTLGMVGACAPVASDSSLASETSGVQIKLRSASLSTNESLSDNYCYALHVTSKSIPELNYPGYWKDRTGDCQYDPPSVGTLIGMTSASGHLKVDLPLGSDIRMDLVAIRKKDALNPFGPDDVCENYRLEHAETPNTSGDYGPNVRLTLRNLIDDSKTLVEGDKSGTVVDYSSAKKFKTNIVASQSNVTIAAGFNVVTLTMVPLIAGDYRDYGSCDRKNTSDLLQVTTSAFKFGNKLTLSGTCQALDSGVKFALFHNTDTAPVNVTSGSATAPTFDCTSGAFSITANFPTADHDEDHSYRIAAVNTSDPSIQSNIWYHMIQQRYCSDPSHLGETYWGDGVGKWFANASYVASPPGGASNVYDVTRPTLGLQESNPIYICTNIQLQNIDGINFGLSQNQYLYFRLGADLDFTGFPGWASIGNSSGTAGFQGHFDGNGYSIRNLTVDGITNNSKLGLFGQLVSAAGSGVQKSSIKNLRLINPRVFASGAGVVVTAAGALAGLVTNGADISNVVVQNTSGVTMITADNSSGGLIGTVIFSNSAPPAASLNLSQVKLVSNTSASVGGDVKCTTSDCGGLVGLISLPSSGTNKSTISVTIDQAAFIGSVVANNGAGGLIGKMNNPNTPYIVNSYLTNSYSIADLSANSNAGGAMAIWSYGMPIQNSYFKTSLHYIGTGNGNGFGGVIGHLSSTPISNFLTKSYSIAAFDNSFNSVSYANRRSLVFGEYASSAIDYSVGGNAPPATFGYFMYDATATCTTCGTGPADNIAAPGTIHAIAGGAIFPQGHDNLVVPYLKIYGWQIPGVWTETTTNPTLTWESVVMNPFAN